MIGREDVSARLLDDRHHPLHLLSDRLRLIPQHRVDPAVQHQVFAVLPLQLDRVHAGLDLQRVERVQPHRDQLRHERADIAAGVQMRLDAVLVRPIDGPLMVRLQDVAVGAHREKLVPLVAHVVIPEHAVEMVASVPDHVPQRQIGLQLGLDHVAHPRRVLGEGQQHALGADEPGMRDIEPEPEDALDPVALLPPDGEVGRQIVPVDAVARRLHAAPSPPPSFLDRRRCAPGTPASRRRVSTASSSRPNCWYRPFQPRFPRGCALHTAARCPPGSGRHDRGRSSPRS